MRQQATEVQRRADTESIRSFRDLRVWQISMDAAMHLFETTKRFPADEKYSLTDQVRRSSRSVAANIAEAWRKRRYPAAFISKLNDAEAEAAETQTHVEIALRSRYLSSNEARTLDEQYEHILAMLITMSSHPDQWAIRTRPRDMATRRHGEAVNPATNSPRSIAASPSSSPRPPVTASPYRSLPASSSGSPRRPIAASPRRPL
jgi:four helix bundle protein